MQARLQRVLRRARRAAAPGRRDDPRVSLAQPLPLSARARLLALRCRSGPTWHNLESSVRTTDAAVDVPAGARRRASGSLIYVSLGSLGSGDVPLMKELVEALAETPHRYVVSKGPQHDEYELADNMVGEEFLPQVSVLPAGRPGDHPRRQQHDHRVPALRQADGRAADLLGPARQRPADHETGFGVRLPTYSFDRRDLLGGDRPAARRLATSRLACDEISQRLQASPGNDRAAELIERVAISAEPITSRVTSPADRARRGISGAL